MEYRPGDIVYQLRCEDGDPPPATLEEVLDPHVVVATNTGELRAVPLRDEGGEDGVSRTPPCHLLDEAPGPFRGYHPTSGAALLARAEYEQDYGEKCLRLAARLRELAARAKQAESEGPRRLL